MLVRVGTCTECEALFQLPDSFSSPWVRCRICEGPVSVGEPMDPAEAGKTRRGGRGSRAGAGEAEKKPAAAGARASARRDRDAGAGRGAGAGGEAKPREPKQETPAAGLAGAAALGAAALPTPEAKPGPASKAKPDAAPEPQPEPKTEPKTEPKAEPEPKQAEAPGSAPVIPARPVAPEWSPRELERRVEKERTEPAPAPAASSNGKLDAPTQPEPVAKPLEAVEPSRKSSGTLERLKRERAAAAAAASQQAKPASEPAPRESTLERLKRERAAQAGAQPPGDTVPAKAPTSAAAPRRQSATRTSAAKESRRSAEPAHGSGRNARRAAGERSSRAAKQRSIVPGLVGIGAVAALLAVGYMALEKGWLSSSISGTEGGDEVAQSDSGTGAVLGAGETITTDPFAIAGIGTETSPDANATDADATDGAAPDGGAPDAGSTSDASPTPNAPVEPEKKVANPDDVDLARFGTFAMPVDATETEWSEAEKQAGYLLDVNSGKKGGLAKDKLADLGQAGYVAIVNGLFDLDFGTEDGMRAGNEAVRVLERICNGRNFGWKQSTEPNDEYYNRLVVEKWALTWQKVLDDADYWFTWAKLDPETGERLEG